MKNIFLVILIICFISPLIYSQENNGGNYKEKTVLSDPEKEAFKLIYDCYKKLTPFHHKKYDLDFEYEYVVRIFNKIDSVDRFYQLEETNKKNILINKIIFTPSKEDLIYNVSITFSPFLSANTGYINIELTYRAAMNTRISVSFILNNNIYESYHYFTSSGSGRTVDVYRINGVEKYSSEHDFSKDVK